MRHPHADERRAIDLGTTGLSMFAPDAEQEKAVRVPDVRTAAPIAPGSKSSELAAMVIDSPFRRASWRKIMLVLASSNRPLSRAELSERTGLPINVVCARVNDLMPQWIEARSGACMSPVKPTLRVEGLELTPAGLARVRGTP